MIESVLEFNQKFGLPDGSKDVLTGAPALQKYRAYFIREELNELTDAFVTQDRVAAFDALLDLVYVVQGTALFMGITPQQWDEGMEAVHFANMSKVRAESAAESKRGLDIDVIKPLGWVPPEAMLAKILGEAK